MLKQFCYKSGCSLIANSPVIASTYFVKKTNVHSRYFELLLNYEIQRDCFLEKWSVFFFFNTGYLLLILSRKIGLHFLSREKRFIVSRCLEL